MSYNLHNGDYKQNSSKSAILANLVNKELKRGIYAENFYDSKNFLDGAKAGGKIASSRLVTTRQGLFSENYRTSEACKAHHRNLGLKNAQKRLGATGRSEDKMKQDNTKAAYTLFTCDHCGKLFNGGNLKRHLTAIAKAKGE